MRSALLDRNTHLGRKYLVGLVSSSGSNLALVARCELSEITVVVTLPVDMVNFCFFLDPE